ncbi:helix-turn-helix domain-containing protein [Frankia sp. Cj3]|uniref:helix-turn-helix domain-containing protein n=2 Tax=Frankia sp. Cj3 TaxID=2880976 RepID=UPI0035AE9772
MGHVIAAYRTHPHHGAPLPQEMVARWMGITQTQLSRIESGTPITDLTKLIRWAEMLRIPEELLWFKLPRQRPPAGEMQRPPAAGAASIASHHRGRDSTYSDVPDQYRVIAHVGEVVIVAMDRRTFLAGSGAGFLVGGKVMPPASYTKGNLGYWTLARAMTCDIAIAFGPVTPFRISKQVAPEAIEYLASQIDSFYAAEATLGPYTVIPSVLVQQELLRQLLTVARGDARRALLRTNAAYAGLVTWLYQDAGDLGTASHWANHTLELAHRVGDTQLIRHALTNKAMICTDEQDGPGTLDLTSAALVDETELCPKVRVQAMQQSAHGFALMGNRRGADYALDKAAALLPQVDDDYPWYNACRRTPGYIEAQRATCYNRLGLGAEAVALWEQVITGLPTTARRDAGVYRARQAVASAQAHQPDAVVGAVRQAVTIAQETSSARLRQELEGVWHHLTPWHADPVGHEVKELLAQL